jgi:hypothetical protein
MRGSTTKPTTIGRAFVERDTNLGQLDALDAATSGAGARPRTSGLSSPTRRERELAGEARALRSMPIEDGLCFRRPPARSGARARSTATPGVPDREPAGRSGRWDRVRRRPRPPQPAAAVRAQRAVGLGSRGSGGDRDPGSGTAAAAGSVSFAASGLAIGSCAALCARPPRGQLLATLRFGAGATSGSAVALRFGVWSAVRVRSALRAWTRGARERRPADTFRCSSDSSGLESAARSRASGARIACSRAPSPLRIDAPTRAEQRDHEADGRGPSTGPHGNCRFRSIATRRESVEGARGSMTSRTGLQSSA